VLLASARSAPTSTCTHGPRLRLGIDATLVPLQSRDETLHSPAGELPLQYEGMATTVLDRDTLPAARFPRSAARQGRILFSALLSS